MKFIGVCNFQRYYSLALIVNLHDSMVDRKHTELFIFLPSVCLSSTFDLNTTATLLQNAFGDDLLTNTASVF